MSTAKKTVKKTVAEVERDKPYTSNYPLLQEWLNKHGAFCNWQRMLGEPRRPCAAIESWTVQGGAQVLVLVRANQNGWGLFTAAPSNKVADTLADAEARLGLTEKG